MKIFSTLMFACVLSIAACGGGKKADTTTKDTTTSNTGSDGDTGSAAPTTTDGQPCTQEIALECPEGQIDGCLKQPAEGDTHTCVAK